MKLIRTEGRGAQAAAETLAALERRGGAALDAVLPAVKRIVADVRKRGDRALLALCGGVRRAERTEMRCA